MKVLLIDDNKSTTKMISLYFKMKGHDCVIANEGRVGLSLIMQEKFDIILLDIAMPDFTGIDVLNELNNNGKINGTNIIVYTASAIRNDEINDLLKRGARNV